jgi:hypothetical protein
MAGDLTGSSEVGNTTNRSTVNVYEDAFPLSGDQPLTREEILEHGIQIRESNEALIYTFDARLQVYIEACHKIGLVTLKKAIIEHAFKSQTTGQVNNQPLSISDDKLYVPQNADAAADYNIHKLLLLATKMNLEVEVTDNVTVIPELSKGYERNITDIMNFLIRVAHSTTLPAVKREHLPGNVKSDSVRVCLSILTYKWASIKQIGGTLQSKVRLAGNLSKEELLTSFSSWGTILDPKDPTVASEIVSTIYDIITMLAHRDALSNMINPCHFLSGVDMKLKAEPSRKVVSNKKKTQGKMVSVHTNFTKLDGIRFLFPEERAELKEIQQAVNIDEEIVRFDRKPVFQRDYEALFKLIKSTMDTFRGSYFKLRRAARQRMVVIKEIRTLAGLTSALEDKEFNSRELLTSAEKLVNNVTITDIQKTEYLNTLSKDILKETVSIDLTSVDAISSSQG